MLKIRFMLLVQSKNSDIRDAKIRQKELVNKYVISNLGKDSDLNPKLGTLAAKKQI